MRTHTLTPSLTLLRLDQLVFVGLAQDRPTQLQVLQAILRR